MLGLRLFLKREWLSLILGLTAVALCLSCIYSPRGLKNLMALRQSRIQSETRLEALRSDNLSLHADVEKLRDDDHYLQTLIRRELGYAHNGELIYKFAADRSSADY